MGFFEERRSSGPRRTGPVAVAAFPLLLVAATSADASDIWGSVVFSLWSAAPVALGLLLSLAGPRSPRRPSPTMAFLSGAAALTSAFHLAWIFDVSGTATSSSTSALAFIFVPVWAVIAGAVVAALAFGFSVFRRKGSSNLAAQGRGEGDG